MISSIPPFFARPITDADLLALFGDRWGLNLSEVTHRLSALGVPERHLDGVIEAIMEHESIRTNEDMDFTWVRYRELPIEQHPEYRHITDRYGDAPHLSKWRKVEWKQPIGYRGRLLNLLILGIAIAAAVGGVHFLTVAIRHLTGSP